MKAGFRFPRYLATAAIALAIILLMLFGRGSFLKTNQLERLNDFSDAFFVSGMLLVSVGGLAFVAGNGIFDMINFGVKKVLLLLRSEKRRAESPRTYYDYVEGKSQNRKSGYGALLIVGAICLGLAVMFLLMYNAQAASADPVADNSLNLEENMEKNPEFTITLENGKVLTGELYPQTAPESVGNFISLANQSFYDGLIFHRVIPGFMIQGGCPNGNGMGGPGYGIKGEFNKNGVTNTIKHTRGVLSMARSMNMNSAGSQFFIMVADAPHLDGAYAAFGKVLSGMEAADEIVSTRRDAGDRPYSDQVIKSIRVETHGVDYPFTRL